MTPEDRKYLRTLVRTMYDYQDMRIRTDNRVRVKADGTPMQESTMADAQISEKDYSTIEYIRINTKSNEEKLMKEIEAIIEAEPLWTNFLSSVRGCGHKMAAVIMSEFDIHRADTVSKMWQFAGLNPGMVRGKQVIKITKKTDQSQIIRKYINKEGKECGIILSDEMIRGDRRKEGFVSPYNAFLRTKLCGVLADGMIKAQGKPGSVGKSYALDYYYPYKARLEQEDGWKDESKGHRDRAAKRYMIKMFIQDLYQNWRTIEGLTVRVPYQEEYLNHKHVI